MLDNFNKEKRFISDVDLDPIRGLIADPTMQIILDPPRSGYTTLLMFQYPRPPYLKLYEYKKW